MWKERCAFFHANEAVRSWNLFSCALPLKIRKFSHALQNLWPPRAIFVSRRTFLLFSSSTVIHINTTTEAGNRVDTAVWNHYNCEPSAVHIQLSFFRAMMYCAVVLGYSWPPSLPATYLGFCPIFFSIWLSTRIALNCIVLRCIISHDSDGSSWITSLNSSSNTS